MLAKNFKKSLLAVNIGLAMGAGFSGAAVAADAQTQAKEDVEVIEVRGIRRSLEASMNTKRFANAVVDAVSAEDIGEFPDNNLAEALGRVPGVTVSRQFGEGSAVSIRGASNSLTLTTLNGQNVASTGWYSQQAIDRTFNYSMLPPEMIADMEVYKSSQADLLEGGVGGTVIVNTRKPLDLEPMTIFGSVKGSGSSQSDEIDPTVSGLVSWKNEAENFGALISVAQSDYTLERRGDEALPIWGGRIAPTAFVQERERTAYDIQLQYAPTDALEFGVHYMNLELGADGVNNQVWIPQDTSNCEALNADGVSERCTSSQQWFDDTGLGANSYWDVRPRNATMETELIAADMKFLGDGFTVEVQVGTSEATGGTNFETNVAYISGLGGSVGTLDGTGTNWIFDTEDQSYPLPAAGEYVGWEGLQPGAIVNEPRTDEETYAQVDVEFETDFEYITSIKTGLRWSDHDVVRDKNRPNLNFDGAAEAEIVDADRFTDGRIDAGMSDISIPNGDGAEMIAYTQEFIESWARERSGYASLNEETVAAYVMANYSGENFRGNFGLRYVSTEATSQAYALAPGFVDPTHAFNNGYSTALTNEEHDYSEVLPSFNLAYDLSQDMILRVSAATVISRPNYNDMFSNAALAGYDDNDDNNQSVTKGTPSLSPFKANQADVGVEYYYAPSSLIAGSFFWKDVDTFTTNTEQPGQSIGIVDPGTNTDNWRVETYTDGDGGTIYGAEFQLQHTFDNGFGAVVNYTYSDSDANAENFVDGNSVFSDASEHTVNTVAFYETDALSLRAAYTWRSEYMIRETGFYGSRLHEDFGTLDLSASYDINENFTIIADVTNLLEEDSIQVGNHQNWTDTDNPRFSRGYPAYNYQGESRYSVGLQFRF